MGYKAFVSSTFEDLQAHRRAVIAALRRAGIEVDPMEDWTAATDEPKTFSQDRLQGCDLCILLVAFRRGHIPSGEQLSITQLEYQTAVSLNIDVLVFLLLEEAAWPRRFDELDKDPGIRLWRQELKESRGIGFFSHDPNSVEIAPALTRWVAEKKVLTRRTAEPFTDDISIPISSPDVTVRDAPEEVVREGLPPVVAVLSPLSEMDIPLGARSFAIVDRDNFDYFMADMSPHLSVSVPLTLDSDYNDQLRVKLRFEKLADFAPEHVADQIEPLRSLLDRCRHLVNARSTLISRPDLADVFQQLLIAHESNGKDHDIQANADKVLAALPVAEKQFAFKWFDQIRFVVSNGWSGGRNAESTIEHAIAQIDGLLTQQLHEVVHHPEFVQLESLWRGLHFLVMHVDFESRAEIRVLNVSKDELSKDLDGHQLVDSAIYEKVYREARGSLGALPITVLVGDYQFDASEKDIKLLTQLSRLGEHAEAPFLAAAGPAMFGLRSFAEQGWQRGVSRIFEHENYTCWKDFRETSQSRFVALVLPRFLLRKAYEINHRAGQDFRYGGENDYNRPDLMVWGNSAYCLATRIARSFVRYGNGTRIYGMKDGLIDGLPVSAAISPRSQIVYSGPTEAAITDSSERDLAEQVVKTDSAVFVSVNTCRTGAIREDERSGDLPSRLDHVLFASRFAHYVTLILRDNLGVYRSPADCELMLKKWIQRSVSHDQTTAFAPGSNRPLAAAIVTATEDKHRRGFLVAKLSLRLHQVVPVTNPWIHIEVSIDRAHFS